MGFINQIKVSNPRSQHNFQGDIRRRVQQIHLPGSQSGQTGEAKGLKEKIGETEISAEPRTEKIHRYQTEALLVAGTNCRDS